MKIIRNLLLFLLLATITTNCGFQIQNKANLINFNITEITTSGEGRINFKLKNKLMLNKSFNENQNIKLNLVTKKNKTVKEKNINNEITKYNISITVQVTYNILGTTDKNEFKISKSGDFNVDSQYSQTLNNEKKLIEILTNDLSDKIFDRLILKLNAI